MPLQTAVQGASGELWNGVAQATHDVVHRSRVRLRNSTIIASSAGVTTVLRGSRGSMAASAVDARLRHCTAVLGFGL